MTEVEKGLSGREMLLRLALLKTLADAMKEELEGTRTEVFDDLVRQFDATGSKSFDVRLPDSTKPLGSVSLTIPKDVDDVDEVAFLAWAKESAPHLLEEIVIPAQEEQRHTAFIPTARTKFLNGLKYIEKDDLYLDGDGQVVEGITRKAGGRPKTFSVRLTPAGKEAMLEAYRQGELEHIENGVPLNREIESSDAASMAAHVKFQQDNPPVSEPALEDPKPAGRKTNASLALELGVLLDDVTGTGKGGRITHDDIRQAAIPPWER